MAKTWDEIRAFRYSTVAPPPGWPDNVRPISIDGVTLLCHLGSLRQLHHRLSQTECDYKQGPIAKNRKRLSFRSRAINQMHRLP